MEKNNDSARRNYFSSNHLNASREVIVTEARFDALSPYEREKRKYDKVDEQYWKEGIFKIRRRTDEGTDDN